MKIIYDNFYELLFVYFYKFFNIVYKTVYSKYKIDIPLFYLSL